MNNIDFSISNQRSGNSKTIPINECHEPLIALGPLRKRLSIIIEPIYFLQEVQGAISETFVRENLVSKLEQARKLLPNGFSFVVLDAWRSLSTQHALFDNYKNQILAENPDIDHDELLKRTSVYVSLPTADPFNPPPHNTGGAIDLTIADQNGNLLEMGTDFDDFTNKAQTAFFERDDISLTEQERMYRENRRLLLLAMTSVGFTNYNEEWWHFDYGDQLWASISGSQYARYGAIEPIK
jgi:D-alanyl-D-alanine dipeptidase